MAITRRRFVTGGLTVLAGSAVAPGVLTVAQIEIPPGTPEAGPVSAPIAFGSTVASVAAELGYDQAKIVEFVTTQIAYEPYVGALRGVDGTLWSRAGNSVDKAILLGALLQESLIEYRFAFGELEDAGVTRLVSLTSRTAAQVSDHAIATLLASVAPRPEGVSAATPAPPSANLSQAEIETIRSEGAALVAEASAAQQQQIDLIQGALADAGIDISGTPESPIPLREIAQHAWVQVADGPAWVDLDPTFGEVLATATVTSPALLDDETAPVLEADDLRHPIAVRLVVEEVIGGALQRRTVASVDGPSTAFIGRQFAVVTLPPAGLDGLGVTINEGFSGDISLVPMIVGRDVSVVADDPIVFGSSGGFGDVLSADETTETGPNDGEAIALFLEIDVAGPDREAQTFSRTLFDRLADRRRGAETPEFADLPDVEIVPFFDTSETVRGLDRAHILTVESAAVPFVTYIGDLDGIEALGPFGDLMPTVRYARDGYCRGIENDAGQTSIIDGPTITFATIARIDPTDATEAIRVDLDLIHRQSRPLILADATDGDLVTATMRTGILDQVAEAMTMSALSAPDPEAIVASFSIATIFGAALAADVGVVAVSSPDALADVDIGAFDPVVLEALLADGHALILPERPVEIDGVERTGVWIVDLASGVTRDLLDDGRGGFSAILRPGGRYAQAAEEGLLNRMAAFVAETFKFLGKRKALCVSTVAVILIGAAIAGDAAGNAAAGRGGQTGVLTAAGGAAGAANAGASLPANCAA